MFEDKEEVQKAMLGLKIFGGIEGLDQSEEVLDSTEEVVTQIFPDHEEQTDRLCKTLYYGKLPVSDRPSLPLTQLAVDQFSGLDARLGRLDVARAAEMTRSACVGPSSLVLALMYLDRIRKKNPDYLTTISSADLFLVSMMVASKFLHDDGEEDEVFNDEWAQSGGMETKEINNLEINFLSAIDWRIFVSSEDFKQAMTRVEQDIAVKEVSARGWATCTELSVLSDHPAVAEMWRLCVSMTVKMTTVCMAAYTAGLLSLLASVSLLEKTSVGPAAVTHSVSTLSSMISSAPDTVTMINTITSSPDHDNTVPDSELDDVINQHRVTTADILTASLLVTSLSSGITAPDNDDVFEDYNNDDNDTIKNQNYTRSLWLSEKSYLDGADTLGNNGKWKTSTLTDQDYARFAVDWSQLLVSDVSPRLSSYLGRCPVLRWGSSWVTDDGGQLWSAPVTAVHG